MKPQPKPRRDRDPAYLEYVRTFPCCVSGRTPVDANHVRIGGVGGTGTKPSDRLAVPLHRELHREYHDIGKEAFELKYQIDLAAEIQRLNAEYDAIPKKPKKERKPRLRIQITGCDCHQSHTLKPKQTLEYFCTKQRKYVRTTT